MLENRHIQPKNVMDYQPYIRNIGKKHIWVYEPEQNITPTYKSRAKRQLINILVINFPTINITQIKIIGIEAVKTSLS